jgi:subtilisin family serine protease
MKRLFSLFVFCLLSCVPGLSSSARADEAAATFNAPNEKQADYLPDEVLVTLSDDNDEVVGQIEKLAGGICRQQIRFPDSRHGRRLTQRAETRKNQVLRIKLPQGKSVKQAISQLSKKDPRIVRVEPNYKVRINALPNDPLFGSLWAMRNTGQTGGTPYADIDATGVWNITTGSDDVVVAVIDTGIDYTHPDLAANIWTNPGEIPGNGIDDDHNGFIDDIHGYDFVDNDGDAMDEHSHGTHVAGTIGAVGNNGAGVTGINWRCKIMACRFLDENGSGSIADAIEAVNYAVANGAQVLSNSWGGGGYSAALAEAITNAKNNGVLFVAAAGNDSANSDASPHYPSCYNIDNVIAVAATDHRDSLASFSNYGATTVHLAAPGVSILSTVLAGSYASYSGTSMATPHVSGVAALLLANDPSMNIYELKSRLVWTGDPIESLSSKTISGRRLNAYNALTTLPVTAVVSPNSQVTWAQGFNYSIRWMSIAGGDTVDIYLLKAGAVYAQLANDVANTGAFSWNISRSIPVGSDYKIRIDDGVNVDDSDANFSITDAANDYFTELFSNYTHGFDLSNKSLLLRPDESASGYAACIDEITELPTNPAGGADLDLDDDDYAIVSLSSGHSVKLYETSYDGFYVGSNGYITFGSGDVDYSESLTEHFALKRIAGLYRDLDPSSSGSVVKNELDDRVAITFTGVPEYGESTGNTFQIELFYDGQIRLSWLSIAAQFGVVGISGGGGQPADFEQSDLSAYGPCDPLLLSIEVTGPEVVTEQSTAQYSCIAYYEDGSTEDITSDALWSDNSDYATIDETGLLTAEDVDSYNRCKVTAAFDGKSADKDLLIDDADVHQVAIRKCTVRAGKTAGTDSISCIGSFDATAEQLAAAQNITVRIYSADDYLVFEEVINRDLLSPRGENFNYRNNIKSGQPGGITNLAFDTADFSFSFKAKNIDLTGLTCPVYLIIDAGSVCLGVVDETVVNGKKPIPVRLMSGYADTLTVAKARVKDSASSGRDRLKVKGTFTVADDSSVTDDVTITWGAQTFTIPGEQFQLVRTGHFKTKYTNPAGCVICADFNFNTCKFKIDIKNTTIATQSALVTFGLSFGGYSQSAGASAF